MARVKGAYLTRGRGLELEREIAAVERRMAERTAELEGRLDEQRKLIVAIARKAAA